YKVEIVVHRQREGHDGRAASGAGAGGGRHGGRWKNRRQLPLQVVLDAGPIGTERRRAVARVRQAGASRHRIAGALRDDVLQGVDRPKGTRELEDAEQEQDKGGEYERELSGGRTTPRAEQSPHPAPWHQSGHNTRTVRVRVMLVGM